MTHDELLARIARTLKREVGPAIDAEYPKTQAYMAAVVLEKIGRQLARAPAHAAARHDDVERLIADLERVLAGAEAPVSVVDALAAFAAARDEATLCRLLAVLYAERATLGTARFETLRTRVRETLRADIDRRVEYAG